MNYVGKKNLERLGKKEGEIVKKKLRIRGWKGIPLFRKDHLPVRCDKSGTAFPFTRTKKYLHQPGKEEGNEATKKTIHTRTGVFQGDKHRYYLECLRGESQEKGNHQKT